MEVVPLCINCNNFQNNGICAAYKIKPPYEIINREIKCDYYTGGEYDLFIDEVKQNGHRNNS